jgi:hypothetical protein
LKLLYDVLIIREIHECKAEKRNSFQSQRLRTRPPGFYWRWPKNAQANKATLFGGTGTNNVSLNLNYKLNRSIVAKNVATKRLKFYLCLNHCASAFSHLKDGTVNVNAVRFSDITQQSLDGNERACSSNASTVSTRHSLLKYSLRDNKKISALHNGVRTATFLFMCCHEQLGKLLPLCNASELFHLFCTYQI